MTTRHTTMPSPLGTLLIRSDGTRLTGIDYIDPEPAQPPGNAGERADTAPELRHACQQLGEYFAGQRTSFELATKAAGTPFQQAVWQALETVAFGTTSTYSAIARAVGRPRAVRAVGAAIGRNQLAIVIPCHRIIGQDGSLTGYAGGLERKVWLLQREGVIRS